jgi:putative membrane protein
MAGSGDEQDERERPAEPDYRFSLANERTFLVWVRTSLALMAAAVAVVKLFPDDQLPWLRRVLGILLGALAVLVSATAYQRFQSVQKAMTQGRPLPRAAALPLLGLSLTAAAVLAVVLVIAD